MTSDRPLGKGSSERNPSGARLGNADPAPRQQGETLPAPGEDTETQAAQNSQPGKPRHGREPRELEPPD